MVALRALQPLPQKQLGRVFQLRCRLAHLPIPRHRRRVRHIAGRRQDLAHELIVRFVGVKAVADPVIESVRASPLCRIGALVPQQRAPLIRKMIRVFRAIQELVDPFVALGRILVRQKLRCFVGRRQSAGNVQ